MADKIIYFNTAVGEYNGHSRAPEESSVDVSRSGALLLEPEKYAVAVFRLVVPYQVPTWIPEMVLPSVDGVSTVYTMTLRCIQGGVTFRGRATFELIKEAAELEFPTTPPNNGYNWVWTIQDVARMYNNTIQAAYAALLADGAALNADEAPFVSWVPGSVDRLKLTAYPYDLWQTQNPPAAGDRCEFFMNHGSAALAAGWPHKPTPTTFAPPDPNGEDIQILIYGDGDNYDQQPPAVRTGLEPSVPANVNISVQQVEGSPYQSVDRVVVKTSLPIIPESIGAEGSGADRILTDFAPDPTVQGRSLQVFNAAFGDARWHSLTATGPVTNFELKLELRQWDGVLVANRILWRGGAPAIKLCFAPLSYIKAHLSK